MMEIIISENQLKYVLEQESPVKIPIIVKLFSLLNKEKKNTKKKSELIEKLKKFLPYFNISEDMSLFLIELYLLNYRKDGNYSSLTSDNFIDPRKQKGSKTKNENARQYTKAQRPFRGSNLEGYWTTDRKGVPFYLVKSYGWYPVFIFKNNKWYENAETYSSSTSKQMHRSRPVSHYSDFLESEIYILTHKEMNMLENGANHDEVMRDKIDSLKTNSEELLSKKKQSISPPSTSLQDKYKVKYKISSIDTSSGKGIITVDIFDVVKAQGNSSLPTPENYLKNELGSITKEKVESDLTKTLNIKFRKYIGRNIGWWVALPKDAQIEYKFNHLKNQK